MPKRKIKKGAQITVHNPTLHKQSQSGVVQMRTKNRVQVKFKNKKLPKYYSKCFIHIDCVKLKKQKSKKKRKKVA